MPFGCGFVRSALGLDPRHGLTGLSSCDGSFGRIEVFRDLIEDCIDKPNRFAQLSVVNVKIGDGYTPFPWKLPFVLWKARREHCCEAVGTSIACFQSPRATSALSC